MVTGSLFSLTTTRPLPVDPLLDEAQRTHLIAEQYGAVTTFVSSQFGF
jgi:hypothetical protein